MKKIISLLLCLALALTLACCGAQQDADKDYGDKAGVPDATDSSTADEAGSSTSDEATVAPEHAKDVAQAIKQSNEYLEKKEYNEALAVLDTAEQLYGKDASIDAQRTVIRVAKTLDEVEGYEKDKDYASAIECIQNAPADVKADRKVIQKLNSLKNNYRDYALKEAEKALKSSGYEKSIEILNEALKYLPDDSEILDALSRYEEYIPVQISSLEYFTGTDFSVKNNIKDNLGNTHDNVVFATTQGWSNHTNKNVYKINKKYSKLTGLWFQLYDYRTARSQNIPYTGTLEIYGDSKLLYSGKMGPGKEPIKLDLKLSGVTELSVNYRGGGSDACYSGIADFCVQK